MASNVSRLPENKGIVLNFLFTKTLRAGSKHLCHVAPNRDMPDRCVVARLEQHRQAMAPYGWKGRQGFLLPEMKATGNIKHARGERAMAPRAMTSRLQKYAQLAGLGDIKCTMHSLRVGAAVAQAIAGQDVAMIMASIGCTSKTIAHRYI
ncbi:unnamed protein product [Sphacelaria rigidula]